MITLLGVTFFWLSEPTSAVWETAANWSPAGPPTQVDSATFAYSTQTDIHLTKAPVVGDMHFNGLQMFRLTVDPEAFFTLNGSIASARTPELVLPGAYSGPGGQMKVTASGNLGSSRVILKGFPQGNGGQLEVHGRAGSARIYVNSGAYLLFEESGNADYSHILCKPGIQGMFGGQIYFHGQSNAETATIIIRGWDSAIQIQDHVGGTVTIGNLIGDGSVFLGSNTLILRGADYNGQVNGGTVTLDTQAVFRVDLSNTTVMRLTGDMHLAGTLEVDCSRSPALNHPYVLFQVAGQKFGAFTAFNFPGLPAKTRFQAGFVGDDYTLTFLP